MEKKEYSKDFCHLCVEDLDIDDSTTVECPICGRVYHEACWTENGGCVGGAECKTLKSEPDTKPPSKDDSKDSDTILYESESNLKKLGTIFIWIAIGALLFGLVCSGIELFLTIVGVIIFAVFLTIGLIIIFSGYTVTITSKNITVNCTAVIVKKCISTSRITDVYYRNFIPVLVIFTSGSKTKLHLIKNGNETYKTIASLMGERDSLSER